MKKQPKKSPPVKAGEKRGNELLRERWWMVKNELYGFIAFVGTSPASTLEAIKRSNTILGGNESIVQVEIHEVPSPKGSEKRKRSGHTPKSPKRRAKR